MWQNPFNRTCQRIAFDKTRVIVFWTKNPAPLIPLLRKIEQRGLHYYFQFTLNDYETDGLEPGVPPLQMRIDSFKRLSDRIGPQRVIWRFDPLMVTDRISENMLLDKIRRLARRVHDHTQKLVFSFVDIAGYQKVQRNLRAHHIAWRPFTEDRIQRLAAGIGKMAAEFGLQAASCAEPHDFAAYDISHNKCIDDDLMADAFGHDAYLMHFLGRFQQQSLLFESNPKLGPNLKDKGQRKACGCIASKDIGQYSTCGHLCLYCYANASDAMVRKNLAGRCVSAASIIDRRVY